MHDVVEPSENFYVFSGVSGVGVEHVAKDLPCVRRGDVGVHIGNVQGGKLVRREDGGIC